MSFSESALKSLIRAVPDFPKPGVIFRDITPLFQSPEGLRAVMAELLERYRSASFTHVGALDARGFLIGPILAYELGKPLVLFRKQGKLPAELLTEVYSTEYGDSVIEVHKDSVGTGDSVLLVDDLIATGGTLVAAGNLIRRLGAEVHEAAAIVDLPELGGSKRLEAAGIPTFALTSFALSEY
ncbi:adenine phosphoribosyltransferase [Pseudomonas oryzihabitans]|uniref:adenine phosphoribosyltransferase n=1 Tax=Pseudomonas oryzihabitans TaxID=47885 RepID=UPI00135EE1E4|nr:adenine phosphoribosyltransferase [Pseudomonas oryzihabitans]MXS18537.1 adenine phosphoribosyltransferase [Pseudomonas oryzihabitans]